MYCKHCGKEIEISSTFCPHCGKALAETSKKVATKSNNSKSVLIVVLVVICVIAVGIVGFFIKQSSDAKKAEEESIAASIAESEAIAESIAQAEAIAESIAQAEQLAKAEARTQYIENLNDFVTLSLEGLSISEDMCNLVYMVWYDTAFEQYREETAAYTMTDGVFHAEVATSFNALAESVEMYKIVADLEANKTKVSEVFNQLSNPTEEFTKCYEVAEKMMNAYVDLYTHANYYPDGDLLEYSEKYDEYSNTYIKNYELIILLIPKH